MSAISYYATSGGLGCADSDARMQTYYDILGYPSVYVGGPRNTVLGGFSYMLDGGAFAPSIDRLLCEPSHFKITINSHDFTPPTGSIDLDIEVVEDGPEIAGLMLRAALTEDNLYYDVTGDDDWHDNVNRVMIDEVPITVSMLGEMQNVQANFDVDASWVQEELTMVAFIQRDGPARSSDDSQWVLTSANTQPIPDYALRYCALDSQVGLGLPFEDFEMTPFRVYNMGNVTDIFSIQASLVGPPDWTVGLHSETMSYGSLAEVTLAPGEYIELHLEGHAGAPGYAGIDLALSQAGGAPEDTRALLYTQMTSGLQVLVVDDDGAADYEQYVVDALEHHGYQYALIDRSGCGTVDELLSSFPAVVWLTGDFMPALIASDRAALSDFLAAGGNLLVHGHFLGWEPYIYGLHEPTNEIPIWFHDYLHADVTGSDTSDRTLDPVSGDPVSDGLALTIEGGDGADNHEYAWVIDPADTDATVIWNFSPSSAAAVKIDTGSYRAILFGFGFEGINNATDRRLCLHRCLGWLLTGASAVPDQAALRLKPQLRVANPVTGALRVHYTLPSAGQRTLRMYGADGRLIRSLEEGWATAGRHAFTCDDLSAQGPPLSAGIYYVKLKGQDVDLVRRIAFLR